MRSLAAALPVDGPSTALASLPGSLAASAIVAVCLAAALLAAVAALCAKTEPRPVAAQPPNNLNTAKVTIAAPAAPPPLEPKREPSVHAAVQVLGTAGRPDKAPADSDGVGSTSASAGGRSSTYDAMTSPSVAPKAPKVAAHGGRVGSYVPTSLGAANVYTAESGVNLTAGTFTNCSDSHAGDLDDSLQAAAAPRPATLVSLSEHMRLNKSDRVLQSRDESVEALCVMLRDVCDRMEGYISASHMLHRHTIREGIYAAIAEATANGVTYTVLFFPDGRRYNRQLRSYDRRWLVDFMPNKALHTPGGPFTHNRTTVMLPPHILVDRCATMADALAEAATPQQTTSEIFMICIQLYHQIYAFHRRDKVIRDISVQNVVSTLAGAQRRWTLLEYCAVAGVGPDSSSVPVRCTPPEHAEAQMALKPLRMQPSYDIWQLGLMIYEARYGPFWPPDATDASILHKLATPSARMPHEAEALEACNVKDMLQVILKRAPEDRPTAEQLRKVLEDHDNSGTVGSFTSPWLEALHGASARRQGSV